MNDAYFLVSINEKNHTYDIIETENRPKNLKNERQLAKQNLDNIKKIMTENFAYAGETYKNKSPTELIGILEEGANQIEKRFREEYKAKNYVTGQLRKHLKHEVKSVSHYIRTQHLPLSEDAKEQDKKIGIALNDFLKHKLIPKKDVVYQPSGRLSFHKKIDVEKTLERIHTSPKTLIGLLSEEKFYKTTHHQYVLARLNTPQLDAAINSQGLDKEIFADKSKQILHYGCKYGHVEAVNLALYLGANINDQSLGKTSLQVAIEYPREELAVALLDAKPINLDIKVGLNQASSLTFLHLAAHYGKTGIIAKLLDAGMDIDAVDAEGRTALSYAAGQGHAESVKILLEAGADPNLSDRSGVSPIHLAVLRNHRDSVCELLQGQHIKTDEPFPGKGFTPLHQAFTNYVQHQKEYLELISQHTPGEKVKKAQQAKEDAEALVKLLLNGANVNRFARFNIGAIPHCKTTLLGYALDQSLFAWAKELIQHHGASLIEWEQSRDSTTPFEIAIRKGYSPKVLGEILGKNPTDLINSEDNRGNTALHFAASFSPEAIESLQEEKFPRLDTLRYLIAEQAELNTANVKGQTPLDLIDANKKQIEERQRAEVGSGYSLALQRCEAIIGELERSGARRGAEIKSAIK